MYRFYTSRNINIGLVIFLALLIFFGWHTFVNTNKAQQESQTVYATLKSLRSLEELMDDMQNVETGHRGFLISGNKLFLNPYHTAVFKLKTDTLFLKEIFTLYPERVAKFNLLIDLAKQKVELAGTSIQMMNDKNRDSLYKEISSGRGRAIMDSIRQIVSTYENEDRAELQVSNKLRQQAATNANQLYILSAGILLITLLFLFWRIKKELKLREEHEKRMSEHAGLIEKISDAVISTDKDRNIKSWNQAAEAMYGYTAKEAIGKSLNSLLNFQYPGGDITQNLKELQEKGYAKGEYAATRKNGDNILIQASVTALRNDRNEIEGYVAVHQDITDRKRTNILLEKFNEELNRQVLEKTAEVNHSNERFEMITRTTNDAIWEWDLETGKMWANQTHQQLYELTLNDPFPDETTWQQRIHPEDREAVVKGFDDVLRSDRNIWITEYRFLSGNGYKYIYDRTYIVRNETGKAVRILGSMMDVTERRKAQESIRTSEETRKLIMNASLDGIICVDITGSITVWTPQSERIFGWSAREVLGRKLTETIIPEKYRAMHEKGMMRYLETGKGVVLGQLIEISALNKEGVEFPIELSIVPIRQGNSEFFCAFVRDIKERKFAEAALKESEEKLRHVLSSSADDFYVIDTDYRITLINKRAEENLYKTWGKQVRVGSNIIEIIPAKDITKVHDDYRKAFAGQRIEYETSNIIDGKQNWVQIRYMPVFNELGIVTGVYVVTKDITATKIAEEELIRSNSRFEMITRTTNDAVWEWDFITGELWGSETHQKLYGLTISDPVPAEGVWMERLHPDDRERMRTTQAVALASDTNVFISEYRFRTEDHGYRDIYDRSYIVRNAEGKPTRMMGSMMDITERKKAEFAVKESEERYRILVENAPEALVVLDMETQKFAMVSDTAAKLFKYSKEELLKLGPIDVSPKYQPDGKLSALCAMEKLQEAIDGGKPSFDWLHLDKDGVEIPCQVWLVRLPSESKVLVRGSIVSIAERRKAEEEIVKINARFQMVSKATSDIVWDWDLENDTIWWNDNYYSNLGYTKGKEAESINEWYDRIHPEEMEKVKKDITRTIKGNGSSWQGDYRYQKKDGTYLHLLDRGFILRDNEGKAYRMIGSMVDMTPIYEAQKKIGDSEEKYRTLVEQAVDAIALYDAKGNILDVNTGSIYLLGYSKEELTGMTLSDILTKEEITTKPVRYDVLEKGESTVKQRSMTRKDGTVIQTEVRSQQLPDGRFLSVIRDLTERINAQELIEKEKELSDSIISSLPGVFYYFDQTGKFLRWNKKMEEVSGYSGEEISRFHPTDFFEGDDKAYIMTRIAQVIEKGTSDAEADFVTKSGEKIPYYFTGALIIEDGMPGILGMGIDITDRKEAEQELEASYSAVRKLTGHIQNIREEERTHIAREIHDELGQQLTVLKMDVSWLNKKIVSPDNKIKEKMKELLLMLDETVRTVRRIASELRPSLLDDLGLMAAMEWQLNEFEKRSGIKTKFVGPEEEIQLANNIKTALFRIFQESLTNVARHSDAKNVSVSLAQTENDFILSIIDDGKGFDKEKLAEKKTLGILGMHERSSMIGGTYNISSKPGKGTIVEVSISLDKVNHIN